MIRPVILREILKDRKQAWLDALITLRAGYRGDGLPRCPLCDVSQRTRDGLRVNYHTFGLEQRDAPPDYCRVCIWEYHFGCGSASGCVLQYGEWLRNADLPYIGLLSSRSHPDDNPEWAAYRAKQLTAWIKNMKR